MKVRHRQAIAHIEEPLYDLLQEEAAKNGQSNSTYIRSLLLKEFLHSNKITSEILAVLAGSHIAHVGR